MMVAAEKQSEIAELEAKIQAIRDSIRVDVASRVRDAYKDKPGFRWVESYVVSALEEGEDPEEWLNW